MQSPPIWGDHGGSFATICPDVLFLLLEIGGEIRTTGHVLVVYGTTYGHVGILHYPA